MSGYWDIHNHILPGVDDGSGSMAETMRLIQLEYDQGVRHIIMTPHYRKGMFEISLNDKEEVFWRVRQQVCEKFPDLQIFLGCEYYATPHMMERITKDARYRMPGGQSVLVEFSYTTDSYFLMHTVKQLQGAGYIPVIAHFERYQCLHKDAALIRQLQKENAVLQMNCDGILGKEGFRMKRFCMQALKDDLVDLIGSDAHNTQERSVHLADAAEVIRRKFGEKRVAKLLQDNPKQLYGELATV